jgi:ABC-type multidrug transport system ATPase subunit
MHAAIRTQELRKVYGTKAAVDGLDLDVPKGSFLRLSRTQRGR